MTTPQAKATLKRWRHMPVYDFLGIQIVRLGPRTARLKLPWRATHTQPLGFVHGGIIATLADAAAGWALFPAVDVPEGCTTLEMKINYLAPAIKKTLVADAKIIKLGRSTSVIDVDVFAGKDLVAKALATYFIRR